MSFAIGKLKQQEARIREAIPLLPEEAFWETPNAATNSVAQLLLHLEGNIRQWILHGVGGAEDLRDRDSEFAARPDGPLTREMVERRFSDTVSEVLDLLSRLDPARFTTQIYPQGYSVSVLEAIFHVTEHFSYHAGQIFLLVKLHSQSDLGFYRHLVKSNKTHTEIIP